MADENQAVKDVYAQLTSIFKEAVQTHGVDVAITAVSFFAGFTVHEMGHVSEQRDVHPSLAGSYALGLFLQSFIGALGQHDRACAAAQMMRNMRPQGEA